MMTIFSDLIALFFPPLCTSCRKRLVGGEKHLCLECISNIPRTDFHKVKDNKLEMLFAGRFPYVRMASYSYFVKGGIIQSVIHNLKYRNDPQIGNFVGELCGRELERSSFVEDVDLLVPVPLHPNRLKQRGYNQALKIADGMSSKLNIPVCSDNLLRVVDNSTQTQQSKLERQLNTEGIFGVHDPEIFRNKHILLIDDILTTGSTVESCIKAILEKCPETRVSIYTIGVVL